MSVKSKKRKSKRLEPKIAAFYDRYNKWLEREPTTANLILHGRWETEEPVKPKWLVDHEEEFRKWAEENADLFDRVNIVSAEEIKRIIERTEENKEEM